MFEGFERITFRTGENIFEDGEEGCCAYLIEKGLVEVTNHQRNRSRRVDVLGAGDLCGEMALIDNQPRTATVTALEDTEVVKINRDLIYSKLAKTDPTIEHLLRLILQRYRSIHYHFTGNGYLTTDPNRCDLDQTLSKTKKRLTEEIHLASDIQEGLRQDQFQLYYQPIVSLSNNRLAGYEALIRWQHPEHGLMSPMQFLNVAEQTEKGDRFIFKHDWYLLAWIYSAGLVPDARPECRYEIQLHQQTADCPLAARDSMHW